MHYALAGGYDIPIDVSGLSGPVFARFYGYRPGGNGSSGVVDFPICDCPFQLDFDRDQFLTALDLGNLIDRLFAGKEDSRVGSCALKQSDFDCDGFSTALDLGQFIDHLFAGGLGPCDPCD